MKKGFFRRTLAYTLTLAMLLGVIPAFAALAADDSVMYADGVYTQTITVEPDEDEDFGTYQTDIVVTIEDGVITGISYADPDSLEDNETYATWAMEGRTKSKVYYPGIAEQVIAAQSTDEIDAVTGATCSSSAIVDGVSTVLTLASVTETETSLEQTTAEAETEEESTETSIDGTYIWTITVEPDEDEDFETYQTQITVVIEDGLIMSITYTDDSTISDDNYTYADRAMNGYTRKGYAGVAEQIIASQSTEDIDAVSTATCSSTAIVEGVAALLESLTSTGEVTTTEAGTSEEETTTEAETSTDETTTEAETSTEETTTEASTEESAESEEADTASLEALIDALSYYAESEYTSSSWEAMQTALSAAQALLASGEDLTQDDVDAVLADLSSAVVALEEAEDSSSDDSSGSDSSSSSSGSSSSSSDSFSSSSSSSSTSTSDSSSTSSDSDSDSDSSDSTNSNSTETGDSTRAGFYAALMVSAVCCVGLCGFIVGKVRKEN